MERLNIIIGTTTNQNLTAFVNCHYFSNSYQGCIIHSLLLSLTLYRKYSFLSCIIIHLYEECREERRSIDVNLTSQLESFICPFPILVLESRFWISSFSICPINFPSSFILAASHLAVLINLFFGHNVILYSFINIVVVICFRSKTQINCYLYV